MQFVNKYLLIALTFFIVSFTFGQNRETVLTADQIIQRAIDSCGGNETFNLIRNVETISKIATSTGDTLSFAVKRMNFDKYYVSTISLGYTNTTTIFNKGNATIVSNQTAKRIVDPFKLEELQLQSYISLEYGYKKLGYLLERQEDQKFENFDCFVILVSSPLGRSTINFYDKKKGNLVMIVYPNLNKSLFIDFYKSKGIRYPSKILMVDTSGAITSSTLTKLNYDESLDSNWFNLATPGIYKAPEDFKIGTFKYLNSNEGSKIVREKDNQTEVTGESKDEYKIEWTTESDYLLYRLKNSSKPPTDDNIEYIKVRIISWNDKQYYCQYINSNNIGGTCAFQKID